MRGSFDLTGIYHLHALTSTRDFMASIEGSKNGNNADSKKDAGH